MPSASSVVGSISTSGKCLFGEHENFPVSGYFSLHYIYVFSSTYNIKLSLTLGLDYNICIYFNENTYIMN